MWEVGSILEEIINDIGPTIARSNDGFVSASLRGESYSVINTKTKLPGGLPFSYLEDERQGSWDFYDLGDFTVTGDRGSYFFTHSCAKACKYRGYVEPKTIDFAESYRVDPGEVLEFFDVIPSGKTRDEIRNSRREFYQRDLMHDDGRVRAYGALKLLNMGDEQSIEMVLSAYLQPKVTTKNDLKGLYKVMSGLSSLRNYPQKSKIIEFLKMLDLSQIRDENERHDFEDRRTRWVTQLEKPDEVKEA